jgi:hypothetical protein
MDDGQPSGALGREGERERLAWASAGGLAVGFALVKLALHLATLTSYGYFRDELYYLVCADHPAWGYVDHPPFSIALLAGWRAVVGDGLEALHVLPAIIGAMILWLTGRLALSLGGGRLAVVLACTAMLTAPARIAIDHYVSMNGIDGLVWVLAAFLVVRVQAAGERRGWLALGFVLGLGLLNKWSVLWFGAGLALAIVATPWRAALRGGGPWIAAGIAILSFAPNLAWQATHGWPTLEFMDNALAGKYVRLPLADFTREVALITGPAAAPVWLVGIIAPLVWPSLARARPLVIVFVTTVVIVAGSRGKPEYLLAAIALPLASGSVAIERGLARLRKRSCVLVPVVLLTAQIGFAALVLPFALPLLSVPDFAAYSRRLGITPRSSEDKRMGTLPQSYADMHGWPELVEQAERAWSTLDPEERDNAVIWAVTGGYGSAAAIDVLGRARGLPGAIATHNNYWLWGFGDADGSAVVLLGGPRERLAPLFESLEQTGTVRCTPCMPYEDEKPIYVGRGMKRPFAEIWPQLKHYD